MESHKTTRWKQRFSNFQKAFHQLTLAVDKFDELDNLGKEGLVQRFEYTFELAWKTLKDYLENQGFDVKTPKTTIKQAFQIDIIENGEMWVEMLEKRNMMTHTYNEATFLEVTNSIKNDYFQQIEKLNHFFEKENEK